MTELLRSLQELFRLHPLPWRPNGFGFMDYRNCVVSSERCARILADYGFDIVPLLEQCAEHGMPLDLLGQVEDVEAQRAKMRDRADKVEGERDDARADLEDAISSLRGAEAKIVGLKNTVDDLRKIIKGAGLDDA